MTWGVEASVLERFGAAGIPADRVSFSKETYTFTFPGAPAEFVHVFRDYYPPTMNAFEAARATNRAGELQLELEALFENQNRSATPEATSIPATFLLVIAAV